MEKIRRKRKKFKSQQSAESFAKKVNGKVIDLRDNQECEHNFTVTYVQTKKTIKHGNRFADVDEWPEEYWRD